jgi:hypothetical protein
LPTPTYIALANITLGSTASSVTFSSIPATYRDLIIVIQHSGAGDNFTLRMNGDTGANYSYVYMLGNGSSTSSVAESKGEVGGSYTGNIGNTVIQIMDYSATDKHKTALSRSNTAAVNTRAVAYRWASTSAVNSTGIVLNSGSFASGSTFALYGIAS